MNLPSESSCHDSLDDRDRLLTVHEAAQFLHLSCGTLYHLISQKRVPVIKISCRCVRFSRRALLLWLESLTHTVEELSTRGFDVRPRLSGLPNSDPGRNRRGSTAERSTAPGD